MLEWFSQHIGGPPIVIFIGALIAAGGALWASVEQTKSERSLKEKNQEIVELSKTISKSITGGDSFAYLGHPLDGSQGDNLTMVIVQNGKYPLYDVNIRIVDLEKISLLQGNGLSFFDAMNQSQATFNVGNIPASTAQMLGTHSLKNQTKFRINIFIGARNGFVTQLVRLVKIDGLWSGAMKVERNGEILLEKIDPKYPLNANKEVDWS